MSTLTQRYAAQCMAGAGFAVMDSRIAWQLRPDLWATGEDCAMSGGWKTSEVSGTTRLQVNIAGYGLVLVLARSTDNLAQRIEWIVGAKAQDIQEAPAVGMQTKTPSPLEEMAWKLAAQKLDKLKELAAQEPPAHDCHLRKEILRARQELARI